MKISVTVYGKEPKDKSFDSLMGAVNANVGCPVELIVHGRRMYLSFAEATELADALAAVRSGCTA